MNYITCPHCRDTYPDFDVAHVCSKGPYAPKLKSSSNERVKQLAEQAGFENGHQDRNGNSLSGELEKFAELIVRECARVYWNIDNGETHTEYVEALKQHFGVEE